MAKASGPTSAVERSCSDYAAYLHSTRGHQQVLGHEDTVQELKARLEAVRALLQQARSEVHGPATSVLPALQQHSARLQEVYCRVDSLEAYVGMVRQQVGAMDAALAAAEGDGWEGSGVWGMMGLRLSRPAPSYHAGIPPVVDTAQHFAGPTPAP
eukprot:comp9656_c0_seq1/m.4664 comp9656_c0_seq1/g.4664  ORF comp9656_c0_seq1/g.4664 comp9656_c0_seq1/m.4664 type:complete len:155 (-) comp9656_c0_seq1:485-949(-)